MVVRLIPWQPEYGTALPVDTDDVVDPEAAVDRTVERPVWAPVTPEEAPSSAVQIIDGVRRVDAHALDEDPSGLPSVGLFGSFAVGAVRCQARAEIPEQHIRVERRYLHGAEEATDHRFSRGAVELRFQARTVSGGTSATALVNALNREMLDAEAHLAAELSRDESLLTLVDGPLRSLLSGGRRVVGYIKRIQRWYVERDEIELLPTLNPGERTPLFLIPPAGAGAAGTHGREGRYSWFLSLRRLRAPFHPLGGMMRLETSAQLPIAEATRLADETALLLPRLASEPGRGDPRAPHNLVPVGALETVLTHRLGDRLAVQRLLSADIGRRARAWYER